MIHTYRNPDVLKSRSLGPVLSVLVLISVAAPVYVNVGNDFTWADVRAAAEFTGLMLVLACVIYIGHRHHGWRECGEIRLSDDGTCELETRRRVIRLHVNEIRSVKYSRDSENDRDNYTIRYQGGELGASDRMTGFADFLTRLQTLNPAVELTGFPADAWPELRITASEDGTGVSRFIRSALFPLIVIALLVFLATETLAGK